MVRTKYLRLGVRVSALVFAACAPGRRVAPAEGPTSPPPLTDPTIGPTAIPSLQQYSNPDFGYSLSYPAGYELQSSFPHTVNFLAPPGTPGHRERRPADGGTRFRAERRVVRNPGERSECQPGREITSSIQVLDGQQAYVLGRLPGQDLNRQVFIVDNGILYHLTFVPDDPAMGEEYQQMEALYAAITSSLRFLPERGAVPPVTEISNMLHHLERTLNARSVEDIARLLGDEFVLGELDPTTPEGVSYARDGPREIIPLILDDQLSPNPSLTLLYQVDWASVPGSLDTYADFFPDEVVTRCWPGVGGRAAPTEAVIIIVRRIDSSLFWRGTFVLRGALAY